MIVKFSESRPLTALLPEKYQMKQLHQVIHARNCFCFLILEKIQNSVISKINARMIVDFVIPFHYVQIARDGDVTSLESALRKIPLKRIPLALARTDEDGYAPLHYAVRYWHYDMAMALVSHGADPSQRDTFSSRTPLHLAALWVILLTFSKPISALKGQKSAYILLQH